MKFRFKINRKSVILFLILMPYLKPYNVTLIPVLDNLFKIWKLIATTCILIIFIKKKRKLHMESIYLLMFCSVWECSLIYNKGLISDYTNNIFSIIGIMLLFESFYDSEQFKAMIASFLYKIGAIYMVLNCITAIQGYPFFAKGMELKDNANFLGGDNYSAFIMIPLAGLMFFYDEKYIKKIRKKTWFYNIVGLSSLIITFSLTGMISYLFLLLMILLRRCYFKEKIFSWKMIIVTGIIFVISISYLRLDLLLANVLGTIEKTGFNGRNMIWPRVLKAIIKKPFIGYGGLTQQQADTWIIAGANHAHNMVLELFFSVGIIGTIFFVKYILGMLKKSFTSNDNSKSILWMTFSALCLCSIFDFYIGLIYQYLLLNMIWINKK